MIDFGFSKKIIFQSEKKSKDEFQHIQRRKISNIIGSPNYISVNVHNLIEPSRRDDLESMVYVLLYLIEDTLPWAETSNEKTRVLKENLINSNYNKTFINILIYLKTLKFEDKPDYKYIIYMIKKIDYI